MLFMKETRKRAPLRSVNQMQRKKQKRRKNE